MEVTKLVVNVRVYSDRLVFDNNEIISRLLNDFVKTEDSTYIEIHAKHGAIEALYILIACTQFKINVY